MGLMPKVIERKNSCNMSVVPAVQRTLQCCLLKSTFVYKSWFQ